MPRPARLVVPGAPHHVIQRGNRKQPIFFDDQDRRAYLDLLARGCQKYATRCLAWCLMNNHVHLILVPLNEDGLRGPLAGAHTAYAQRVNLRQGVGGHLFQGRFASYPMDDAHLMVAVRYIENNPVAARLAARAEDWRWSSARAHVYGAPDALTDVAALAAHAPNWRAMLSLGLEASELSRVEDALRLGRPQGGASWLRGVAEQAGLSLERPPRGRPRKQ